MDTRPAVRICTLDAACQDRLPNLLIDDGEWLGDASVVDAVVLPSQGEIRACALLGMGAPRIYLGEAALRDSELVPRLAAKHGAERIGVYVPCGRMEVSWSLETQSNADFKTLAPSICEPSWEILLADGTRTGTLAGWWLGAMFERGAGAALVQVDMRDDADLNICAALTEAHGGRLWFAPFAAAANRFDDWIQWGKTTQIAVGHREFDGHPVIQSIKAPAVPALEVA